jgi:antitoxin MazE
MSIVEACMQVAKWGNSLAVRLPKAVVDALNLQPGDEIEIRVADERKMEVRRAPARGDLMAQLRALRGTVHAGFTWSRDEAHDE